MAMSIYNREPGVKKFLKLSHQNFKFDSAVFKNIQFKEGIYTMFYDTIYDEADWPSRESDLKKPESQSESFYNDIVNGIGFKYYDPTGYQSLKDYNAEDNLWHWDIKTGTSNFEFTAPQWKIPPLMEESSNPGINIKIRSLLPSKILYLYPAALLLLLVVFCRIILAYPKSGKTGFSAEYSRRY